MEYYFDLGEIYPTLMDLSQIETPEFVSGKSFAPLLKDSSALVRKSALTELWVKLGPNTRVQGYSLKTNRYRLTQWGKNGVLGYELYDHKSDRRELSNLSMNKQHQKIKDSLIEIINYRIAEARKKPKGLGPQFEGVSEWDEPETIHSQPK